MKTFRLLAICALVLAAGCGKDPKIDKVYNTVYINSAASSFQGSLTQGQAVAQGTKITLAYTNGLGKSAQVLLPEVNGLYCRSDRRAAGFADLFGQRERNRRDPRLGNPDCIGQHEPAAGDPRRRIRSVHLDPRDRNAGHCARRRGKRRYRHVPHRTGHRQRQHRAALYVVCEPGSNRFGRRGIRYFNRGVHRIATGCAFGRHARRPGNRNAVRLRNEDPENNYDAGR